MTDTLDHNQVGPPVAAAIPNAQTPATATAQPLHDPERFNRVQTLIDTLADLTSVIRQIDDRSTALERDRRIDRETESPEAAQIWRSALEPMAHYLSQSVQLSAGSKPLQLADAADQLAGWVSTWRENALGPGGQGLQEDDQRLASFEQKISSIDPSPEWLEQEGQRLLSRPELDPDTIRRTVAATQQSLAEDKDRQAAIDQTLMSLETEWDASITPLEAQLTKQRSALQTLIDDSSTTDSLRALARDGLRTLDAIDLAAVVRKRVSLGEWVAKYRADREFTSDQVSTHINQELRPALRQAQAAIEQAAQRFAPHQLRTQDEAATTRRARVILDAIDKLLGDTRNRYQVLVALRRTKLGQEPDERFFGEMARQVNTAITELGTLEADLLQTRSNVAEQGSFDHAALDRLRKHTADTIRHSADFATPAALEKLLTKQAQLKQAKERELAEAEAKRVAQEKQAADQAAAKERARREHEERQQATEAQTLSESRRQAELEAANQTLRLQQQTLGQELTGFLTQLQSIEHEQQRRATVLESLIAAERTLLVADQQKLLENRTERRAMTAGEAEGWLKTLADSKHSLEQRQEHLDKLTKELLAIQSNPSTISQMTSLRTRIAQLTPQQHPTPTQADAPSTAPAASESVRIAIGRHP